LCAEAGLAARCRRSSGAEEEAGSRSQPRNGGLGGITHAQEQKNKKAEKYGDKWWMKWVLSYEQRNSRHLRVATWREPVPHAAHTNRPASQRQAPSPNFSSSET